MQRTTIEWVKNPDGSQGYSFNPVTGCLGPNGTPCSYCYARKLANGRLRHIYTSNNRLADYAIADDPFAPRFWPEKLEEIEQRGRLSLVKRGRTTMMYGHKPRGIFVCSQSDLFGIGVPGAWKRQVMDAIRADPVDRFYLLTKQYDRLNDYSPFADNTWVGVTATDWGGMSQATGYLKGIRAKVKYLSLEPLLNWQIGASCAVERMLQGISWVIIGSVTKCPELPQPKPEWIEEIVRAADQAEVKVWLKNSLASVLKFGPISYPWAFVNGKLRQEIP